MAEAPPTAAPPPPWPGKKQKCETEQGIYSYLWDPLPGSGNGVLSSGCALMDSEF